MTGTTVLLVDDQPLLRTGFRMILEAEPDLAVAGEAVLAPRILRRMLDRFADRLPDPAAAPLADLSALTDREQEVFVLMARGRSNFEITGELFVSETTVKTHVGHVLAKLGLRDRVQAVVLAYEIGLVRPNSP